MLLLSPLFLIVAIIIMIDDGFPIFFRQKRIGINNTVFWVYKFRTMKNGIPEVATHLLRNPQKFYTYIGPFIRKLSIDELPQLMNIIKGNMVFIGPRPALHNQDDLVELRTRFGVHKLMPGITGWAQVNGRDKLNLNNKVKMDIYYLKNKSLWLDIKILFMTTIRLVFSKGISH